MPFSISTSLCDMMNCADTQAGHQFSLKTGDIWYNKVFLHLKVILWISYNHHCNLKISLIKIIWCGGVNTVVDNLELDLLYDRYKGGRLPWVSSKDYAEGHDLLFSQNTYSSRQIAKVLRKIQISCGLPEATNQILEPSTVFVWTWWIS